MSAQHTWDTLRSCWIDVYIGPPDVIAHDAGTNFASSEFRQYATSMLIKTKEVPIEAHNSIGLVERYHAPLRRAYNIICDELKGKGINNHMLLQMAVKAVNDTAGPDGLIPTLLVFGAIPRLAHLDPPAATITQRANAIKLAMKELRHCRAKRQVNEALNTRNGPRTSEIHSLKLNSDVLVWRENEGWTGPFKLLGIDGETCCVDMPNGQTNFRSTSVKPLHKESDSCNEEVMKSTQSEPTTNSEMNRRNPDRERRKPAKYRDIFLTAFINQIPVLTTFFTSKEMQDQELVEKLRSKGVITTKGEPFQASREKEIRGLIEKGVFKFTPFYADQMKGLRLFKSRFVDEIKGKGTKQPYEKSRLVVQAYNDEGKHDILTQSPTIQRCSQR